MVQGFDFDIVSWDVGTVSEPDIVVKIFEVETSHLSNRFLLPFVSQLSSVQMGRFILLSP